MNVRAIIAAAALALAATPAHAQVPDPFARELASQLASADRLVAEENYQRAAGPFSGGLAQGGSQVFNVTLRAGQDYRMLGVCDGRCSDVDMRVLGPNAGVIAEDADRGNVPVVSIRPEQTGRHEIEVEMAQCGAARCWFAFNVYAR